MLHCQQLTNNAYAITMLIHASVIQQLLCTTSFNTSNSLQRNLKNVLQNCAERPIGECMREKYKPFLDTKLTLLFTLFSVRVRVRVSLLHLRTIERSAYRHTMTGSSTGLCFAWLLDINVPVVTCHASKQTSEMAMKGDFKPSRLNALMHQRLVARNTYV